RRAPFVVFKPGQSGNPQGRPVGGSKRSPVLRAMSRVMKQAKAEDREGLEQNLRKWYESDIAGYVKEFNRLRALEEQKGEQPGVRDGKADSKRLPVDPGMQKAMGLLKMCMHKMPEGPVVKKFVDEFWEEPPSPDQEARTRLCTRTE